MMRGDDEDDEDKQGFLRRNAPGIAAGVVAVAVLGVAAVMVAGGDSQPTRKVPEPQIVQILTPPPPPPPPPPEPPPPEEQVEEQPEIAEPEMKEEAPKDEPEEAEPEAPAPGPLGLDQEGTGPGDSFGLAGRPGGGGLLGSGSGGGGGSRFGWYAAKVQTAIEAALRDNRKTRKASIAGLRVQLWLDATGNVTRVRLAASTGDAEVDRVIENEILRGRHFEPPPSDMPQPIVMRIKALRPG